MPIAHSLRRHGDVFFVHCSWWQLLPLVAAVASSDAVGQRVGGNGVNIANKIAPWVIEHTAYGQQAEFFVVLEPTGLT